MAGTSFGRAALTTAWVGGGCIFVGLAAWDWTGSAERAQFVRLGVVWTFFGVAHFAASSPRYRDWVGERDSGPSLLRSGLLGLGIALVLIGFVLSGRFLVAFGVGGLLLVAVAVLADS